MAERLSGFLKGLEKTTKGRESREYEIISGGVESFDHAAPERIEQEKERERVEDLAKKYFEMQLHGAKLAVPITDEAVLARMEELRRQYEAANRPESNDDNTAQGLTNPMNSTRSGIPDRKGDTKSY